MLYDLALERWKVFSPGQAARMQISADIRKAVAFFGYGAEASPTFVGTGFFQQCRGHTWLVTAAHVAEELGAEPFYCRTNASGPKHLDNMTWVAHPDENVDVAVMPVSFTGRGTFVGPLPEDALVTSDVRPLYAVDLGNFVYAIGLFWVLPGVKRNIPVVHTGHIAALLEDEPIPVQIGSGARVRVIHASAYLVQGPGLDGLSGAPVFVRRTKELGPDAWDNPPREGSSVAAGAPALLGVWISSWKGAPGAEHRMPRNVTVPVGFGVVVPAQRVVETVEEYLRKHRVTGDAAGPPPSEAQSLRTRSEPSTTEDNPQHREDFNRLLDEAARRPKRDDQT